MIDAVTLSLTQWLRSCLPRAVFRFEAVTGGFPPECGTDGVVRVSLYDVREHPHHGGGNVFARDESGMPAGRLVPARFYRYSYLVTAWHEDPLRAQGLLGDVLLAGASRVALPDPQLQGALAGLRPGSVALLVAPSDPVPWPSSAAMPGAALPVEIVAPMVPAAEPALAAPPERVAVRLVPQAPDTRPSGGPPRVPARRPVR